MEVKSTVRCMLKDTLLGRHTVWSTQCMRMCAIQCDYMRRCEAVEEEEHVTYLEFLQLQFHPSE